MRAFVSVSCAVLLALWLSPSADAGPNANAKVLVHLSAYQGPKVMLEASSSPGSSCQNVYSHPTCNGIVTRGSLYPPRLYPYAYLLVVDGDATAGISGLKCSIDYRTPWSDGVDIFAWLLCGSSESPVAGPNGSWPMPLSTNTIVWNSMTLCQRFEPGGAGTGVVAVAGSFYLGSYNPDSLSVIPSPIDGLALVMACNGEVDTLTAGPPRTGSPFGISVFSQNATVPGYNPCGLVVPVKPVTWSGIKTLSRD